MKEKKMIKFSFILPSYNVAPYVGRCIESIEAQDIPREEYEVICVDDCSKDNTVEVIEQYQARYSNVRLVRHAVNQTAGGARNTGIREARGEYLWFVDPDDEILPNVLPNLYRKAGQAKADIMMFNYQDVSESGRCVKRMVFGEHVEPLQGQQFLEKHGISIHHVVSVYAGIYRRDFLNREDLRFPEIKASQDVVFIWESLLKAERYVSIEDVCYSYIRRDNSTTGSRGKFSAQSVLSHCVLFSVEIEKLIQTYPEMKQCIREGIRSAQYHATNNKSRNILYAPSEEKKVFYHLLQQNEEYVKMLYPIMNRKTQTILNCKTSYILWRLRLWVYTITNELKHRPKTY